MEAVAAIPAKAGSPSSRIASGGSAEVRSLCLRFGGHQVLNGVTFELQPGEMVLLRGENGSGKSVLLNVLSGYITPDSGSVRLRLGGRLIDTASSTPTTLARNGLGRLWQDIRLFPTMSVLDNVMAATVGMVGENPLLALLARPSVARQERLARERALQNLETVGMADRAQSSCDMLSGGQMKRVALARLLQMQASLLLLDEPFAGLDADGVAAFARDFERLRDQHGKTILVVEHRHEAITRIADHVWTMSAGRIEEGARG